MKKLVCICLSALILLFFSPAVYSENEPAWEAEYARIISQITINSETKLILADIDYDDTPELFAGDDQSVSVFTFQNDTAMKTAETKKIPITYFEQLKAAHNSRTNLTVFMGQVASGTDVVTYQMQFLNGVPQCEVIATEHSDHTGTFQRSGEAPRNVSDCTGMVAEYLSDYLLKPFTICTLSAKEVEAAPSRDAAVQSLFLRYQFLSALSDDTASFGQQQREAIKAAVGEGSFHSFDKISKLGGADIFVQFYVNDAAAQTSMVFPYTKYYAVVTNVESAPSVSALYSHESELDTDYLSGLKTWENEVSNIYIDYGKTSSFRGIDDYINYLSAILSSDGKTANENGKKAISEYMEYAVNKCSRTEIKAKNNTVTVTDYDVSFIAENATDCMSRLGVLCESQEFSPIRKARTIPELICSGLDLTKPVRIEYAKGLSQSLAGASGIRLMLDDRHGIYLTASDLDVLEHASDVFCIEFQNSNDGFSVVFTDKNNQVAEYISAPVWFIAPAESEYSTVMASFQGGTDNWGGQFDPKNKTIEFSTNYSGDYDIVENDITINDISTLSSDAKEAVRFMVSKGIFTVDKQNNFLPDQTLSRYDFTAALVKMFYATNVDAVSSFSDVPESSPFYRYVASAEEQNIAAGYADGTFRGNEAVSKEQVVALCGRTLIEKKEYTYPENDEMYLKFLDADQISKWARPDVAVAARCGLISNAGTFSPGGAVTRAEGAEILYKTFMLLYDVSPVTTISAVNEAERPSAQNGQELFDFEFRIAICIVITVLLLFIFYLLVKVNKRKKQKNEP